MMHFSLEEVRALPEGGGFGLETRVIDGKPVSVPVQRPIACYYVDDTTPLMWREPDGTVWRLGRYLDGEWFKQRSYV
jgi:hypothetical protein